MWLIFQRAVSSVGLEHYLDRVGVTGSNPVQPTKEGATQSSGFFNLESNPKGFVKSEK